MPDFNFGATSAPTSQNNSPKSYILIVVGINEGELEILPNFEPLIAYSIFWHNDMLVKGDAVFMNTVSQTISAWRNEGLTGPPPARNGVYIYDRFLGIVDSFYRDSLREDVGNKVSSLINYYRKNLYTPYSKYGKQINNCCEPSSKRPLGPYGYQNVTAAGVRGTSFKRSTILPGVSGVGVVTGDEVNTAEGFSID